MSRGIRLRGIGWAHERCMAPLRAGAELWSARHGVDVVWEERSLQAFGDQPVEQLVELYDLVSIDHPFVGIAHQVQCLSPLDELLDGDALAALADDALGPAHAAYRYAGHQWALATDGACQVAAARADLLGERPVPRTWKEVTALARELPERVAIPLKPADAICSFLSLCANSGAPPPLGEDRFVEASVAEPALALLAELAALGPDDALALDPPALLDRMTSSDEIVYTPLLFGYALYAAPGRRPRPCRFLDIPSAGAGPVGAILGGSGLAVSAASRHPREAAAFAAWLSGGEAQRDVVGAHGGQPGSRSAWDNPAVDAAGGGFMSATRASHVEAYVRPRDPWWAPLQLALGATINDGLRMQLPPRELHARIEAAYRRARSGV